MENGSIEVLLTSSTGEINPLSEQGMVEQCRTKLQIRTPTQNTDSDPNVATMLNSGIYSELR